MALFVSSFPDVIDAAGQTILTDEIKSSLKEMSSEELKAFSDNVSRIIDIVNEAAQQAIVFRTTGYYTGEERQMAVDLSKKTAEAARKKEEDQAEAKRIEDEKEVEAKRKEDDKQYNKWLKSIYDEINLRKDIVREYKDKLNSIKPSSYYQKAIADIDEISHKLKTEREKAVDPRYAEIDEMLAQIRYRLGRLSELTEIVENSMEKLLTRHTDQAYGIIPLLEKQAKNAERMKDESQRQDAALKNKEILAELKKMYFSKIRPLELALKQNEEAGIKLFKEYKKLFSDVIKKFQKIHDEQKEISVPKEPKLENIPDLTSKKSEKDTYIQPIEFMATTTCKFKIGDKVSIIKPENEEENGIFEIFYIFGSDDGSCGAITLARVFPGGMVSILDSPKLENELRLETEPPAVAATGPVQGEAPAVGPVQGEAQPQFAAEGSVQGEAQPQFAAEGSVQGEPLAVQAPQGEAPAVGPVQGEAPAVGPVQGEAPAVGPVQGEAPAVGQPVQGESVVETPAVGSREELTVDELYQLNDRKNPLNKFYNVYGVLQKIDTSTSENTSILINGLNGIIGRLDGADLRDNPLAQKFKRIIEVEIKDLKQLNALNIAVGKGRLSYRRNRKGKRRTFRRK